MADTLFMVVQTPTGVYTLPPAELHHAVKVLRMRPGDTLECTDGVGALFVGQLGAAGEVVRLDTMPDPGLPLPLHLYVSPTRQPDRLEWMLEKCVELGLGHFTPLLSERTQAFRLKPERLQSIALAAMKQSKRAFLPHVYPPMALEQVVAHASTASLYLATCTHAVTKETPSWLWKNKPMMRVCIGPEGDFTPEELKLAQAHGAIFLDLGPARLRTETAGLSVVHFLHQLYAFL